MRNCAFCGASGTVETVFEKTDWVIIQTPLSSKCSGFLCMSEPVTQEAIDRLIEILKLQRDTFPTASSAATWSLSSYPWCR